MSSLYANPEPILDELSNTLRDKIQPEKPCPYPPGSPLKVLWLHARYCVGVPLWNPLDCDGPATQSNPRGGPHPGSKASK